MILAHEIRLYPNKEQDLYFRKACGIARFAYNWGLAYWKKEYLEGNKPNGMSVKKDFNAIKRILTLVEIS
jgi:putative transposase